MDDDEGNGVTVADEMSRGDQQWFICLRRVLFIVYSSSALIQVGIRFRRIRT